jgi:hypothetical protein
LIQRFNDTVSDLAHALISGMTRNALVLKKPYGFVFLKIGDVA